MVLRFFSFLGLLLLWVGPGACAESARDMSQVEAYLDAITEAEDFSGAVLIAKGDDIILKTARGWADRDLGVPLTPDHIFRIGSLTKPVTAAAVLKAVEEGLITLNDRLCQYLDPCPEAWATVTLRHLLSHTSGIADYFGEMNEVPLKDTAAEIERVIANPIEPQTLEFEPGADYAYRNFNFVLLAYVLEQATGMPWEDYLRAAVFEPLQMTNTQYDRVYDLVPGRVHGYAMGEEGIQNILYDDHAAYAAGGLLSTPDDTYDFLRGFMTGAIVNEGLVKTATTAGPGSYGLGFAIRPYFGKEVITHTGGIDGFSTVMFYYPEEDIYLIVFNNFENDAAILRACDVSARLFDWPLKYAPGDDLTPRARCGLETP